MKLKIYFLLFLCISKSLILSEEQTEGIDNSNFVADPLGDSGSFKVIAGPEVNWQIFSNSWWLNIEQSSRSGVGTKEVNYSVLRNSNTGSRIAEIDIYINGSPQEFAQTVNEKLIEKGSLVKFVIPNNESIQDQWLKVPTEFNDSEWKEVVQPVGWESPGGTMEEAILSNINEDMFGVNASGYFRFPFQYDLKKKTPISGELRLRVDDGYVAYLNGVEIDRKNVPESIVWNSRAAGSRGDVTVLSSPFIIDLNPFLEDSLLLHGENVLAVQALNLSDRGSDFFLDVEMTTLSRRIPYKHIVSQNYIDPDKDTDGDGLNDIVETGTGRFVSLNNTGSDPRIVDTDGDGFDDFQEIEAGVDPTNASKIPLHLVQENFVADKINVTSEFNVGASNDVDWWASSLSPWISINGSKFSTGNGNVNYTVERNGTGENRVGKILIVEGDWSEPEIVVDEFEKFLISSLRYSPKDLPNIAFEDYADNENSIIRFAEFNGRSWDVQVVNDSSGGWGNVDMLDFDFEGNPIISFWDINTRSIKFSRRVGGVWRTETVVGIDTNIEWKISMALRPDGQPAIAYSEIVNGDISHLKYTYYDGINWVFQTVDSTGDFISPSLAFGLDGNPRIAYANEITGSLYFAKFDGTKWETETVPNGNGSIIRPSLSIGPNGKSFVSYVNQLNETSREVNVAVESVDGWNVELVKGGENASFDSDIMHGPDGLPSIVMTDFDNGNLEFARFDGDKWNVKIIDSQVDAGWPSLTYNTRGLPAISYFENNTDRLLFRNWDYLGEENERVLIYKDSEVKFFIPKDDSLGEDWKKPSSSFDDSSWDLLTQPVGFETPGGPLLKFVNSNVQEEMKGINPSAYFRYKFQYDDEISLISDVSLSVIADDGFVVYLNGEEVSRKNAPENLSWNSSATTSQTDTFLLANPTITQSGLSGLIQDGENILAVHGLNVSKGSGDFLFELELKITEKRPTSAKYHSITQTTEIDSDRDTDGDGLADVVETGTGIYISALDTGTDPRNPDTDDDGLSDSAETNSGIYISEKDTGSSPHKTDSDEDSISDFIEVSKGTNPNKNDTDGDGLSDLDESNTGIFISLNDTGTDPSNADSDGDGLIDSYELGIGRFSMILGFYNWDAARQDALSKGGDLATFSNLLEWQSAIKSIGGLDALEKFSGIWIGATDRGEEGQWDWVTGQKLTINKWAEGEPDNFLDADAAEIGGGISAAPGFIFDSPSAFTRAGYLLETGFSSNPLEPDSDRDGFTDGQENNAGTDPLLETSFPDPSPVIEGISFDALEGVNEGTLIAILDPSHPNGDVVSISLMDNPDHDKDGKLAFRLEDQKLLINDSGDFDYESNMTVQVKIKAASLNSLPSIVSADVILQDDRGEDYDGDGIIESDEEDIYQTSDLSNDSDGDGLIDSFEIGYGRFKIVKGTFSWNSAIVDADLRGGQLATFASQNEWDIAIESLGEKPFDDFTAIWIGLTKNGNWNWIDGTEFNFDRWASGEPRNYDRVKLYGKFRGKTPGRWYAARSSINADGYFLELGYATDPAKSDTDNDGVNDKVEIDQGTNPTVPNESPVADFDSDGWVNDAEKFFGSDPNDMDSVPNFSLYISIKDTDQMELLFPGAREEKYQIEMTSDLRNWLPIDSMITGNGDAIRKSVSLMNGARYFRVKKIK